MIPLQKFEHFEKGGGGFYKVTCICLTCLCYFAQHKCFASIRVNDLIQDMREFMKIISCKIDLSKVIPACFQRDAQSHSFYLYWVIFNRCNYS